MKVSLIGLVVLFSLTLLFWENNSLSQSKEIKINKLDPNKPTVYFSFDSFVSSVELCQPDDIINRRKQAMYRLRLNNNTTTPINLDALSDPIDPTSREDMPFEKITGSNGQTYKALPKGSLIRLCYECESMVSYTRKLVGSIFKEIPSEREVPEMDFHCSCKLIKSKDRRYNWIGLWIPPGGYVFIDVPQKYLDKQLKIYTIFNYEWELGDDDLNSNEPHHQVFFYSYDIPKR